ncbi:hypothetical protein SEA_KRADAL_170 [Streptomyces phage Kradal]|nr:hypothetical protein SEA_KRADAL_170 [Streptomyces phage Kradal]QPL14486.1 hypothetical protein SEA_EHYELIMAYOE_171 [Streptomyces phage EhyElimayoE]
MKFTMAQRATGLLVSSGHNSKARVDHEIGFEVTERNIATRTRWETGRRASSCIATNSFREDFFSAEHVDDDTALIAYHGSPLREADRFRLYRLTLENCSFTVTEEDDPAREGRKLLRVVR